MGRVREVKAETDALDATRVFLIHDAEAKAIADDVAERLGEQCVATWSEVIQHVPVDLAERARAAASEAEVDMVVCIGGGSSTGLAKAVALSHGLPILAVPTTYAGSEMTPIYGLTGPTAPKAAGEASTQKKTGRALSVLPRTVVYDPQLTVGLPRSVTGPSAFNALAHAVEAIYAPGHNPVVSALALEAVRAIHRALPSVMADPTDLEGRSDLLYGAYLAGVALGATAPGLHHKICHVLGGTYNLVHADAHSVVLPHAVAFNVPALTEEMARLAEALRAPGDPAGALWDLAVASSVPTTLQTLGMPYDGLDEVAQRVADEVTSNPVPVTPEGIRQLLEAAWQGSRPSPRSIMGEQAS